MHKCGAQRSSTMFAASGSKTCLTAKTAAASLWEARALGLPGFEAECAAFIGEYAKAVADEGGADPLVTILAEVIKGGLCSSAKEQLMNRLSSVRANVQYARDGYVGDYANSALSELDKLVGEL